MFLSVLEECGRDGPGPSEGFEERMLSLHLKGTWVFSVPKDILPRNGWSVLAV